KATVEASRSAATSNAGSAAPSASASAPRMAALFPLAAVKLSLTDGFGKDGRSRPEWLHLPHARKNSAPCGGATPAAPARRRRRSTAQSDLRAEHGRAPPA